MGSVEVEVEVEVGGESGEAAADLGE